MKVSFFASLLAAIFFVSACHSPSKKREPQQSMAQELSAEEQAFENTFQNLMKEPTDKAKLQRFAKFLRTQLGIYYIAQDLMEEFDSELDKVHQASIKTPDVEPDQQKLEKYRQLLRFAWEFSNSNLHEMQYIYRRLLEEANTAGSPLQSVSYKALTSMNGILDDEWKFNRWSVISVAQEFESVHEEYLQTHPAAKPSNFGKFLNIPQAQRDQAYRDRLQSVTKRKRVHIDNFLETKWNQFVQQKKEETEAQRTPQTVDIEPSSGPNGHINGSRFKQGVWSLTFDDGPHKTHTPGMIDALRNGGYEGTFFWLTRNMLLYPGIVEDAGKLGMKRASHSYTHANLPKLSSAGLEKEITQAATDFLKVVGSRPTFFRCPYGACNGNESSIRKLIAANNMIHVAWNVDTLDWQDKNPKSIFERARKQMEVAGRGIVLFHDIHPQSVEATKMLVNYIQTKAGWQVKTLDEIVEIETGKAYPSP